MNKRKKSNMRGKTIDIETEKKNMKIKIYQLYYTNIVYKENL